MRNSISPPAISVPVAAPVEDTSSSLREDRANSKGVKDRWDDDFAFIDPKHLVAGASGMVHSHSATNLNSYQLGHNAPEGAARPEKTETSQARQIKRRRSTGSSKRLSKRHGPDRNDAYSYVSLEVEWALGKHLTPSREPKLDSSSDEEVDQPVYENKIVAVDIDDEDSLYEYQ